MDFKTQIEKLRGAENWTRWKRQILLFLRHHEVLEIVTGGKPETPAVDAAAAVKTKYEADLKVFRKGDALAQLILVGSLNDANVEVTATCDTAKETWDKLTSIYEQSSGQRVDRLLEQFFTIEKTVTEDIATHVGRLERNFRELNDEMKKLIKTELPELLLMSRVMSTLPVEYFEFKSVWESVPVEERTINKLTERLRLIEMRLPSKTSESVALLAKSTKKTTHNQKKALKCFRCHKLGHYASKCPEKSAGKALNAENSEDTLLEGDSYICTTEGVDEEELGAFVSTMEGMSEEDLWLADSGASAHMTGHKEYFSKYEVFLTPRRIQVGNKEIILAYGKGIVNIEVLIGSKWQRNHLVDVWYVPKIGRNLFSISQNIERGFKFQADRNGCTFTKGGAVKLTGKKTQKGLYTLEMRVRMPEIAAEVFVASAEDTVQLWHERLCHQNKRHVKKILKQQGIDVSSSEDFCEGCVFGKQHRKSFHTREKRPDKAGELINADVCGHMQEDSIGGAKYFVCFKDDFSKFRRVFFLKAKSEVVHGLKIFLNEASTAGHTVKEFLCDGGKEFDNKKVREFLEARGICFRISMPYTPEQNGAAERENRTLVESARSMIHAKNLPIKLWAEAVNTAAYVLNHTGPTSSEDKTPFELWFGRKAVNIDHLRIFGTECFVHVPKQLRKKWDKKSIKGFFVGYCGEKDGFRVWDSCKRKIFLSRDVIFKRETLFLNKVQLTVDCGSEVEKTDIVINRIDGHKENKVQEEEFEENSEFDRRNEDQEEEDDRSCENHEEDQVPENFEDLDRVTEHVCKQSEGVIANNRDAGQSSHRVKRVTRKPDYLNYHTMVAEYVVPDSFDSAMASSEARQWKEAMEEEMASLAENETWKLVDLPKGKRIVENRWVLRVKEKSDGTFDRFKARLVAKGYSQRHGIDYEETFSPVARFDTVRAVLSVAASENLQLQQFDVKTAFLYGKLQEEVYMRQPEGYDDGTGRVCRLYRSLYGLKQAPRSWNKRFVDFMKKENMICSSADSCLFMRKKGSRKLLVAIYVDDGLVAGSNSDDITLFIENLRKEFQIKVGSLDYYLGVQITRFDDGSIFLNQSTYTKRVLEKFGMLEANAVTIPCERDNSQENKNSIVTEDVPYRQAVGSLMYLVTSTRPDIAYAVSVAAEKLEAPKFSNWMAVKRIFRYLKGTLNYGLLYKANNKQKQFETFSDADFAGDLETRRSRTGVVCKYSEGAISWLSQKQQSVVLSTTEAEYVAASEGTKQLIWTNRLLTEITNVEYIPTIFVDNDSAIKLAKNPEFHKRSKHIEIRHHFVRDKFREGVIEIEHIAGENQLADIMTKPLTRVRFQKLRSMLGVISQEDCSC